MENVGLLDGMLFSRATCVVFPSTTPDENSNCWIHLSGVLQECKRLVGITSAADDIASAADDITSAAADIASAADDINRFLLTLAATDDLHDPDGPTRILLAALGIRVAKAYLHDSNVPQLVIPSNNFARLCVFYHIDYPNNDHAQFFAMRQRRAQLRRTVMDHHVVHRSNLDIAATPLWKLLYTPSPAHPPSRPPSKFTNHEPRPVARRRRGGNPRGGR